MNSTVNCTLFKDWFIKYSNNLYNGLELPEFTHDWFRVFLFHDASTEPTIYPIPDNIQFIKMKQHPDRTIQLLKDYLKKYSLISNICPTLERFLRYPNFEHLLLGTVIFQGHWLNFKNDSKRSFHNIDGSKTNNVQFFSKQGTPVFIYNDLITIFIPFHLNNAWNNYVCFEMSTDKDNRIIQSASIVLPELDISYDSTVPTPYFAKMILNYKQNQFGFNTDSGYSMLQEEDKFEEEICFDKPFKIHVYCDGKLIFRVNVNTIV